MDLKRKYKAITHNWLIALVVLCSICTPKIIEANSKIKANSIVSLKKLLTGGTITMLETILRINTFNEDEEIQEINMIQLNSGLSLNLPGCRNSICEYNVQHLPKGLYKVKVKTSRSFFNETITVK